MNFTKAKWQSWLAFLSIPAVLFVLTVAGAGCNSTTSSTGGTTGTGDTGEPLSFDGTISGKLVDSQSTKSSITTVAAGQEVPPSFDTTNSCVTFKDLAGNDLMDPQGNPIGEVPLGPDGSFSADDLPVGTDFTVCGDIGKDGDCDIESCVQIAADENGMSGELTDVQADPLTTVVLARLRAIIEEKGIDIDELPISPAVVVERITEAYKSLFEDTGVDHTLTLDEILDSADGIQINLAKIFEEQIPVGVQAGMQIVEGNLGAFKAGNAEALALSVAEVFLRAGFPIIDFPQGVDLSPLGLLDGISTTTEEALFGEFGSTGAGMMGMDRLPVLSPELLAALGGEIPTDLDPALLDRLTPELQDELLALFDSGSLGDLGDLGLAEAGAIIYINSVSEPDRNFGLENKDKGSLPRQPMLSDHILVQMARLQTQGRKITLGDLHAVLTDIDGGLGGRLTYFLNDPNFFGPPLTVFETADGKGKALNIQKLFSRLSDSGFVGVNDEAEFEAAEVGIRTLIKDLLQGTVAPTFERMFEGILAARLEGIGAVTGNIRGARAHLPFNNSGPSSFFVLADGDEFRGEVAGAVTVDVEISRDGVIGSVTFNPAGEGKFYLGFSPFTEDDGTVEFLVRETGRFLHGARGPAIASIFDETVFQPVDGLPFSSLVSESGTFYPGIDIPIIKNDFSFDGRGGGGIGPDDFGGSTEHLFVLATGVGFEAKPARVNYNPETGIATFNPGGRFLLTFLPDSEETGIFGLFNEDTGQDAGNNDPMDFFGVQMELPEGFEEFFNEIDFDEFDSFDDTGMFIDDVFNEFDATGMLPPPPPPGDGTMPPPGDGTMPPPDDGTIPPAETPGVVVSAAPITIDINTIEGLVLGKREFAKVFGTEAPNTRFDATRDPFFDDVNANGIEDAGETTSPFRPTLFDPGNWRSTDIRLYYRRASGGEITYEDVDFGSLLPATLDGEMLVTREYLPRMNAFKFGRPNTAINLLTAFAPADFFNGTKALNRDTVIDIFSAIAFINLAMDQVFNVVGNIDIDGLGPIPRRSVLTDAQLFVAPIGDPFLLLVEGFKQRSTPATTTVMAPTTETTVETTTDTTVDTTVTEADAGDEASPVQ